MIFKNILFIKTLQLPTGTLPLDPAGDFRPQTPGFAPPFQIPVSAPVLIADS